MRMGPLVWIGALAVLASVSASTGLAATPSTFLVLAPERFRAALKEYLAFKRRELPTRFQGLERVVAESPGVDDPERVKRFLLSEYRHHQVRYVLLVGDVDVLPVRYMVLDRVTPEAFDYAFYPSDLYYADLLKADGTFDNWNAREEGFHAAYFGEVRGEKNKTDPINFDGIDYRPDLAVGRWPVSNEEEVHRLAAKSMRHEQRLARPGQSEPAATFVAVGGWVDSRPLMRRLAGRFAGSWGTSLLLYDSAPEPAPTEDQVVAAFNAGPELIFHAGHGTDDSWEQCFFLSHSDRLRNADRLPVVLSAGCSTARFATLPPYEPYVDVHGLEHAGTNHREVFHEPPPPPACYQRGRFNPPGLGEHLLRASDTGAVAYYGCTTGSQPCGLTLLEGFAEATAASPTVRLGDAWVSAVRFYHRRENLEALQPNSDWYPPSIFFQGMKFMLFGDPTLPLRAPPASAPKPS